MTLKSATKEVGQMGKGGCPGRGGKPTEAETSQTAKQANSAIMHGTIGVLMFYKMVAVSRRESPEAK